MADTVTCGCGETFVPEGAPGSEARCPRCFQTLLVPLREIVEPLAYRGLGASSGMMTQRATDLLGQTSIWVRIMSILMFVASGFMLLASAVLVIVSFAAGPARDKPPAFLACVYIPIAILYIIPALFLWRYARHSKAYARARHESSLEEALQAQKSFWKFVAISALIVLAIYMVLIPIVIIAAAMNHP
jgi:hypothetical protein